VLYDDGGVALDDDGLTIRRYYLWGRPRRIRYGDVRSVERRPLSGVSGKWRLWGSGDFVHWWNLDPGRPRKRVALEVRTGGRIIPTITPDDPDAVERILVEHGAGRPG
jgi:hypothetical protein